MFDKCFADAPIPASRKQQLQAAFTEAYGAAKDGELLAPRDQIQAAVVRAVDKYKADMRTQKARALAHESFKQQHNAAAALWVQANPGHTKADYLMRQLGAAHDGKGGGVSAEGLAAGYQRLYNAKLANVFETIGYGVFGKQNADNAALFVRALYGETEGVPPELLKAAKQWEGVADDLRRMANDAGADIGDLDNWLMPQTWSGEALADAWRLHPKFKDMNATQAAAIAQQEGRPLMAYAQEAWVDYMMPRQNRQKHLDQTTGIPLNDAQLRNKLAYAWLSIKDAGAQKGTVSHGTPFASRLAPSRQIHMLDATSWTDAMDKFGSGPIISQMHNHVRRMVADIGVMQKLGPRPAMLLDEMLAEANAERSKAFAYGAADQVKSTLVKRMYEELTGDGKERGVDSKFSKVMTALRNIQSFKLGSAAITSFTDNATMHLQSALQGGSAFELELWRAFRAVANKGQMDEMVQFGVMGEALIGQIHGHMRHIRERGLTGKAADLAMRASLLPRWTEARGQVFGMQMLSTIGRVVSKAEKLSDLKGSDARFFRAIGVDESIFAVWKKAKLTQFGPSKTVMDVREIEKLDIDQKLKDRAKMALLAGLDEQTNTAVLKLDLKEKTALALGTRQGTAMNEVVKAMMQFKRFPLALVARHWNQSKLFETPMQRLAYRAGFVALTTAAGGAVVQAGNVLLGKDPQSMDPTEAKGRQFYFKAMMKGGAFSVIGDLAFDSHASLEGWVAGPLLADVGQLIKVSRSPFVKGTDLDPNDMAAGYMRVAKSWVPGATLWYSKAITDHLAFQNLQEFVSPGYLRRMESRARRDYGQDYWWKPGEFTPERLPDVTATTGE